MALSPALLVGIGNILTPGAGGGGISTVMRAMGQNTYTTIAGFGIGSANRSQRIRTLHRNQERTDRIRARFAVFYNLSTDVPIIDKLFTTPITFGCKFELNPVLGFSGLGLGTPFTWDGSAMVKRFDPSGWDPNIWIIETDDLPIGDLFGRYLEKDEVFGIRSCQALDSGVSGNLMPYQRSLTNYLQRYTGRSVNAADSLAGGTGGFFTGDVSYGDVGTNRVGTGGGIGPVSFMTRVPKTTVSMFGIGDSITQDQKVGYGQNPALFDVMGDAEGNRSFFGMAAKRLGVMAVDTGRGSHGDKYFKTPANWPGLKQILATSNPTCVDILTGANDYTSASNPGGRADATAYDRRTVKQSGTNFYMAMTGGTTGTGTAPTGTGTGIVDGTVVWNYVGAAAGDNSDFAYNVLEWRCRVIDQVRAVLPLVTIRMMSPLPKGGGTADAYATPGTVAATNFIRAKIHSLYFDASLKATIGYDSVFSLATAMETAQNNGVIRTNGSGSYILDPDGVHPVDQGHVELAALYPAPPAVTPAQSA